MFNEKAYGLGANRSVIRELFEYGRKRTAEVGPENVFDFSLGNPSIPRRPRWRPPPGGPATMPSLALHGYTTAAETWPPGRPLPTT